MHTHTHTHIHLQENGFFSTNVALVPHNHFVCLSVRVSLFVSFCVSFSLQCPSRTHMHLQENRFPVRTSYNTHPSHTLCASLSYTVSFSHIYTPARKWYPQYARRVCTHPVTRTCSAQHAFGGHSGVGPR